MMIDCIERRMETRTQTGDSSPGLILALFNRVQHYLLDGFVGISVLLCTGPPLCDTGILSDNTHVSFYQGNPYMYRTMLHAFISLLALMLRTSFGAAHAQYMSVRPGRN